MRTIALFLALATTSACGWFAERALRDVVLHDGLAASGLGTPVLDASGEPVLPDDFPIAMPPGGLVLTSVRLSDDGWAATVRYTGEPEALLAHFGDQASLKPDVPPPARIDDDTLEQIPYTGRADEGCEVRATLSFLRREVQQAEVWCVNEG